MGYVHDAHMQKFLPPTMFHYVTGTWSDQPGKVTHTIVKQKSAAAETSTVTIPLAVPGNEYGGGNDGKGSMINSVDIDYFGATSSSSSTTSMTMQAIATMSIPRSPGKASSIFARTC